MDGALIRERAVVFAAPWTVAIQAPLPMGFSRSEYWSEGPFPSLGDPPDPGIKPTSLACPALVGGFLIPSTTWEAHVVLLRKGRHMRLLLCHGRHKEKAADCKPGREFLVVVV